MKRLSISFMVLALMLGCAATGGMKGQVLIPLTDKIYVEEYAQNIRLYHMEISDGAVLNTLAVEILDLNGVQEVRILAYQISVLKSPLFKFEDIQPEILRILKK